MSQKEKTQSEINVELLTEIKYLRRDFNKMEESLEKWIEKFDTATLNFVSRKEIEGHHKELAKKMDDFHDDFNKGLAKKLDASDFEPYRKIFMRINWIIISAVVLGLLAVIGLTQF